MTDKVFDIAIIGAGPGGYIAAIRAAQLGASVVIFEKDNIGGTCLNQGCIPSKVLLSTSDKLNELKKIKKFGINIESYSFDYQSIVNRKNQIVEKLGNGIKQIFKSYNITSIHGEAKILGNDTVKVNGDIFRFKNLIIATGSKPSEIPNINIDHKFVIDSNDILKLDQLPESVLIVGSGAIGLEWARIISSFGKKVTLVEIANRILPTVDKDVSARIERLLKKSGIEFYKETSINGIINNEVSLSNGKVIEPEIILLAVGRTPNLHGFGLENLNIELSGKFIKIDKNYKTSQPDIFAIGDLTGKMQLAHVASHQAVNVIEYIINKTEHTFSYDTVPLIVYGQPEIASVGFTEQDLIKNNYDYKVSTFPMSAVGKALIEDDIDGFVKVLSISGKIIGAHAISKNASMLIQQFAIAMQNENSVAQIKNSIFAHPTYSESVLESVLGLERLSLNLPKVE